MTDNEQCVAIAEWMGELDPVKCKPSIEQLEAILASSEHRVVVTMEPSGEVRSVRDYTHDLNAMHDAEKRLERHDKNEEQIELNNYVQHLMRISRASGNHYTYQATAAQRAEALLRTVGLWRE